MKHYRSYMDRITAPAGLRQRVLEAAEQGARPRRPARRLTLRLAALSASRRDRKSTRLNSSH